MLPRHSPSQVTSAHSRSSNRHHALHIPEITCIIVSFLSQIDLIHCRGVSNEWRQLFSPFLKLHALYQKPNPVFKALFEDQLRTLGPFVYSLKQVIPIPQELEAIQQTCPRLGHVGLYVQRKQSIHLKALVKFFESMRALESISFFSFDDIMVTTLLQGLATYQPPPCPTMSASSSSSPFLLSYSPCVASISTHVLKNLEIGNASHSLKLARIQWEHVMFVLLKHPQMRSLTLRDAHLHWCHDQVDPSAEDWSRNIIIRAVFGAETQRQWNGLLDRIGSWRFGGGGTSTDTGGGSWSGGHESCSSRDDTFSVSFSKLSHLVLDGMLVSEDLLCHILELCPGLKSLELSLSGSIITPRFWARWLPYCPLLESVKVKNTSGSINIDVPCFWSLAPPTLRAFHFASDRRQITFPEISPINSATDLGGLSTPLLPGSTLVLLELSMSIRIADRGLPYVMTNCRSLESLVIGIQYFSDWEIPDSAIGSTSVSPASATNLNAFPEWACGGTLKSLELRVFYLPQDLQFDERIHMFMRRLDGLRVLERLSLPLKLLSDLSESQHEDYSDFNLGVLEHLEQQALLQEQFPAQASFSLSTPDLGLNGSTAQQLHQPQQHHQQQQQQQREYRNVLPRMPSVQEVILSSSGSCRLQIRMRYMHILMEALSGLTTVWASPGLCGLDSLPWFKQLHDRFQAQYGSRGVALNLGSPAWGE
ncbi:hypothetical protein BGX23_012387 [Mortierella sp. AD031]|nr:hypothetical protein BGX23_012387 [Mortierella sp. AD031]KAG0205896.1 hypothetical protein BGX33_007692 [Mortierella sp. NVP41]